MKYFNQLFSFTICVTLVLGHANNAYAGDSEIQTNKPNSSNKDFSAHAYNRKNFCTGEDGAEALMTELQKANAEKFEQIEIYKDEIAELVESDKLISSTRDIKNRYMNSLAQIAKEESTLVDNLGYAQSIKSDGTVLQGISSQTKTPEKSNFLDSVKAKYQQIKNSFSNDLAQDTQKKVDQVVAQIPKDISPEQIKKIMQSESSTINKLLEKNLTKDDISACLGDTASEDACKKIGIGPTDKALVIEKLQAEMTSFSQLLQNKPTFRKATLPEGFGILTQKEIDKRAKVQQDVLTLIQETKTAMAENTNKLDQLNVKESTKRQFKTMSFQEFSEKTDYEKAKEQIAINEKKLVGTDIFFYNPPIEMETYLTSLDIDFTTKEGAKQAVVIQENILNRAIGDANTFNKDCDFSKLNATDISQERIDLCHGLVAKIIPKIDNLKNSHLDRIAELNTKVQKLASDTNFADVENLKKYIAEKYMCSCNKRDNKSLSINEDASLVLKGESCTTQFLTLSKIEGLSYASNAIADALYAHEIKIPMDAESCVMTPEKLKPFSDTCNSNKFITNNFNEICKQITDEYTVKVQNEELVKKQNAKWEKYNEENYVEYNSKSPTGYSAVKKKSAWRVVGEGVLPVIPNALPIWLGNMQMKNNISMLTDQALMQKQYLHNVDIYNQSPWLYNYNYFGYGNPFMPGSNPLTGNSGLGGSGGFNFGQ